MKYTFMTSSGLRGSVIKLLAVACVGFSASSQAQVVAGKTARIVVPFTPGSILDTVARFVAARAAEELGQPVVVENRGGAGGRIGAEHVARSAPDGQTILFGSVGSQVGVIYLAKNLSYDPVKDFTPISLAVEPVAGMVIHPSIPANSLKELVEYGRKNPGKLNYATNGVGTIFHVAGELVKAAGNFDMVHVPMQGAGDVMNALVGGHVNVAFSSAAQFPPHVASGKVKLLAMATPVRYAKLPNVPTMAEEVPGFDYPGSWLGFFGPANLPASILERWHGMVVRGLNAPEVKAKLEASGMTVVTNSPREFSEVLRRGIETFGRAVKIAGIKPE